MPKAQGRIGTGQQSGDSKDSQSVSTRRNKKSSSGPGNSQRSRAQSEEWCHRLRISYRGNYRRKHRTVRGTREKSKGRRNRRHGIVRGSQGQSRKRPGGTQKKQATFRGNSKQRDQGRVRWGLRRRNKDQQREQQGEGRNRSGQGKQGKARGSSRGVRRTA